MKTSVSRLGVEFFFFGGRFLRAQALFFVWSKKVTVTICNSLGDGEWKLQALRFGVEKGAFFLEVDFLEGSSFFFFLYWSKAAVTILTGKRIRSR